MSLTLTESWIAINEECYIHIVAGKFKVYSKDTLVIDLPLEYFDTFKRNDEDRRVCSFGV